MPTKAKTARQRRGTPAEARPTAARRGYDRQWRKLRDAHLKQHPLCTFCGHAAAAADHIKPLSQGGERLDPDNCRSVCNPCHAKLTTNLKRTGSNTMPTGPTPSLALGGWA
ncbi:MAG: HNH endonuclease signature motif containing protein [Planctomycetota bacterium]